MQVQMKRAGEDREKENKDFQQTVADQRASQKLLQSALNVLKGFYEKEEAYISKVTELDDVTEGVGEDGETPAPTPEPVTIEPRGGPFELQKYEEDDPLTQFMDDIEGILEVLSDYDKAQKKLTDVVDNPEDNKEWIVFMVLFIIAFLALVGVVAYYCCIKKKAGDAGKKGVEMSTKGGIEATEEQNVEQEV